MNNHSRKSKSGRRRIYYILTIFVVAGGLFWWLKPNGNEQSQDQTQAANNLSALEGEPAKKGVLKNFTGPEFRELYDSFAYPNSQDISESSTITTSAAADQQIRKIAEQRGYKKRSAPVSDTFVDVGKGMLLQKRAAKPWLDLKAAAAKAGYPMTLTAAYRSAEDQKSLFLNRLGAVSLSAVASGQLDAKINDLLRTTAIPGYSRHHTGYTIDLACDNDPNVPFENSECFTWLSRDNYKNAKEHGWIPSYPDGAGKQGPDPEAWEYVWVGTGPLTE